MPGISPTMFILAWMAMVSCLMGDVHDLRAWEAFTLFASVVSSLMALIVEAGVLDSGSPSEDLKFRRGLNVIALVAFSARLTAAAVTVLTSGN